MRLDRFDLNLLVTLEALLEERNVTRAAERLHIGQSAASSALARLREHFNDLLLVPAGRELMPTPLARSLVAPVRDTLLSARATIRRRPSFDPATASLKFTLRASDYVTTVLLADAVRRISREAPGITLNLLGLSHDLFDSIERGHTDVLVMPQTYAERLDHPQTRVFDEDHVCIAWRDHPDLGDSLSVEQYLAMGHVSARFNLPGGGAFEDWLFPRYRHRRRVETSVSSFSLLPQLVVGTRRLAVVQRRLAVLAARTLPLKLYEVPIEVPTLVEMLIWPRHLQDDPAHRWLREALLACARDMAADPQPGHQKD
ncbi:LysR family transcriptional regulator [Aquabacterium sp. J223]|uniref:LysR family transcriptional regulator n=1 Tax=Aquabacterium sp. J223 TaxID=2898431 RepID=UPI0021ADAED8|nr:LysR family transcriptional regulator [Aquabacterium sp. J223]UUX97118.1 LysR family transcriptional regulator [Aquabacterium sp. J223]